MAQTTSEVSGGSFAFNLAFDVGATETTVLDAVPVFAYYRYGITITCNSGSMTACALYGSMDNINYIAVSTFSTFAASSGQTKHAEAAGVFQYLRLTATGISNIDAHLNAIQGG